LPGDHGAREKYVEALTLRERAADERSAATTASDLKTSLKLAKQALGMLEDVRKDVEKARQRGAESEKKGWLGRVPRMHFSRTEKGIGVGIGDGKPVEIRREDAKLVAGAVGSVATVAWKAYKGKDSPGGSGGKKTTRKPKS
jgi:hypothetical protein